MRALLATLLLVASSACSFELPSSLTDDELDPVELDAPKFCETLGGCDWDFGPDSLAAE
jgi:hypothetical protein